MPFPHWITRSNKRFLNPQIMRFAPRVPPFAVVHHVGRRSGREYAIPVLVFAALGADRAPGERLAQHPGGQPGHRSVQAVFALTYGRNVDWLRNVEAAGTFRLTRAGREYEVGHLWTPTTAEGLAMVPRWTAAVLRVAHVEDFLAGAVRTVDPGDSQGR